MPYAANNASLEKEKRKCGILREFFQNDSSQYPPFFSALGLANQSQTCDAL